jgi:acyl carrier protein
MSFDKSEILKQVRTIISQALKVDENKVSLESSLIKDLGAESIDFLDIVFRLEKAFKIKIPKGELFPEKILTDARFVKNGQVTTAGIDELKTKMHNVNWDEFTKNPQVSSLGNLFTVGMIVGYLSDKLQTASK